MRNIDGSSGGRLATLETQNHQDTTPRTPETSSGSQSPLPLNTEDLDTIWTWNASVPETISRCMHDLFIEQAAHRPDHPAVQSWDGTLTYSQLDDLSTRLASHLIRNGVVIGTRIPLCFEKSMWAVVALVGAMKAGATVSLTDPSQPEARLRTIVEQTGAKVVLTSVAQRVLGERIASDGQVVPVSQDLFNNIAPASSSKLPVVPPSSPMYIIFTSGSTGKPKGVVLSHESYTSGAIPRAKAVGYKSSSRVFDFPSYAFDVTYDCMLCTLSVGGTICVPSEEDRMNDLSGAIRNSKANMVHMTPSVARVLEDDIIPSLDVLGLGGEAVGARDAGVWGKDTSLIIAYGPSECTVGCTINNTVYESTGIGRGVGGVTWIVDPDDHNRLTPLGGVGELLIEGPVVGIGYLGEPEKTAEVFIKDPDWLVQGYGSTPGRHGRLYKTGDLVRYEDNTANGSIEFVGRKDQQVKLRGQRVELAEVEHHVRSCLPPGVKVAAEVVKPERGSPSLVAFLAEAGVAQSGADMATTTPSNELAEALKKIESVMAEKVPRYMVPASFITLNTMPSLVSGKTDRKRLREFGASASQAASGTGRSSEGDAELPQTDSEKGLQRAWTKVLGLEGQIYRGSSFFALGGDSLRAMRLMAAARDEGLALTVADVFSSPTLRDMASKAAAYTQETESEVAPYSLLESGWNVSTARSEAASLCGFDPALVEDIYPCTPLQEALMALSAKVKEAYVAQRVVDLDGIETAERLIRAFSQAAKESPILRTRIVQVPGRGLVQVVVNEDLDLHRGDDLASYLTADRNTSMSLGKPLVRYAIIQDRNQGKVSFVLTMHHALYDGWSMPLVVERVNRAYHSKTLSRPADFRNFIRYLSSLDRSASADYWRENLAGAYANQFPRLPKLGYQVKADSLLEEYISVPNTLPENTTIATLIRAAWALVAAQYVGCNDVVFGETLTGRNAPLVGAEEIEGPMITTVPFRVHIDGQASVTEYLQAVQAQTVAQIPHEHYGLQHIRRLSPDALQACELGAGLVLHPSGEEMDESKDSSPADLLVPAGDAEAAQEALKFNTYALMLVCSIDPKGFLVMASFDSKTVEVPLMQRILKQLAHVTEALCSKGDSKVREVERLLDEDLASLRAVYDKGTKWTLPGMPAFEGAYIVDEHDAASVLPLGAPGKLIVRSSHPIDLSEIEAPSFFKLPKWSIPSGRFYDTGKLAMINLNGEVSILEAIAVATPSVPRTKRVNASFTRRQRTLRSLWTRVLQIPEMDIGLEDSFFALGGDSIYAMKLVSEARAHGILLSVMQIFDNKSLQAMAEVMEEDTDASAEKELDVPPFGLLDFDDEEDFVKSIVKPQLANSNWVIKDIFPARPLQTIAVKGTTQIPRFSTRYELIKFKTDMPAASLRKACHELVARNEILRTIFIEHENKTYGVVLDQLETQFVEYDVDGDVNTFCHQLCRLDVMTCMPLGSSFVKWFFVRGAGEAALIFRISHAQYDEMCLPIMLHQLSALYDNKPVSESKPFSKFVAHIVKENIPASIPYWQNLLAGASMTMLVPDTPITKRNHFAIEQSIDLTGWSSDTTLASLPTAAWALTLARRLSTRDVFFGEVVSGRKTGFPDAPSVTGPCWQYLPFRLVLSTDWTGYDLLSAVQTQHVSSAAHEGMALSEMAELCNLPNIEPNDWFGSVVHQAVKPVTSLDVQGSGGETETIYVHEEPLLEWNVQAFFGDNELTIEVITVESWREYAKDLLQDIAATAKELIVNPGARLF